MSELDDALAVDDGAGDEEDALFNERPRVIQFEHGDGRVLWYYSEDVMREVVDALNSGDVSVASRALAKLLSDGS